MTIIILVVILIGAWLGHHLIDPSFVNQIDDITFIVLCALLFFVGIGIGQNKSIFQDLKKIGIKFLLVPIGTVLGSLLGGIVSGMLLHMDLFNSLAIASGFGYYSLSSTLLFQLEGVEIGTIAFLTNVLREVLALLLIPFLAKYLSGYSAVTISGATSMDTTLPLIKRATNEKIALIAFIHGVLLSIIVPFLVNLFAGLS